MQWSVKSFEQLTVNELYAILKLRVDVFVVEQNCIYAELDNKDNIPETLHLFAVDNDHIVAYMRLFPPGNSNSSMSSFGRVVTHPNYRGSGIGHQLLSEAIKILETKWPNDPCHISAQSHLTNYYQQQGFKRVGNEYLEDGIPHVGMERLPPEE